MIVGVMDFFPPFYSRLASILSRFYIVIRCLLY